jgi:hypothetical protein
MLFAETSLADPGVGKTLVFVGAAEALEALGSDEAHVLS